jgi:hypothetical protein
MSAVSPYTKAALFVIRLIAFGLIMLSLCLYSTDLYLLLAHRPPRPGAVLAVKGLPFVAGLMVYWKSHGMARQLTKDLD